MADDMARADEVTNLTPEEVAAGLRDGRVLLVDVREPNETAHGMIPGSLSMPLSQFDPAALRVEDGRRLVFSCAAGVRSRLAVEAARRAGVEADAHLASGFKGWVAAGAPIVY